MKAMLQEMAVAISDEIGATPQIDGEDDAHFIADMFYIAADPAESTP